MKTSTSKLPTGSIIVMQEVNRTLSSRKSLEVTEQGSWLYNNPDDEIYETPHGKGNIIELVFMPPIIKAVSAKQIQKTLMDFGLDPDPRAQAAYNADNPNFTDDHANITVWSGEDGKLYAQKFYQYGFDDPQSTVEVIRSRGSDKYNGWWICGSRRLEPQALYHFSVGHLKK